MGTTEPWFLGRPRAAASFRLQAPGHFPPAGCWPAGGREGGRAGARRAGGQLGLVVCGAVGKSCLNRHFRESGFSGVKKGGHREPVPARCLCVQIQLGRRLICPLRPDRLPALAERNRALQGVGGGPWALTAALAAVVLVRRVPPGHAQPGQLEGQGQAPGDGCGSGAGPPEAGAAPSRACPWRHPGRPVASQSPRLSQ